MFLILQGFWPFKDQRWRSKPRGSPTATPQLSQTVFIPLDVFISFTVDPLLLKKDLFYNKHSWELNLKFLNGVRHYVVCWLSNDFNDFTSSWMSMLLLWHSCIIQKLISSKLAGLRNTNVQDLRGQTCLGMVQIAMCVHTLSWCFSTSLVLSPVMECLLCD